MIDDGPGAYPGVGANLDVADENGTGSDPGSVTHLDSTEYGAADTEVDIVSDRGDVHLVGAVTTDSDAVVNRCAATDHGVGVNRHPAAAVRHSQRVAALRTPGKVSSDNQLKPCCVKEFRGDALGEAKPAAIGGLIYPKRNDGNAIEQSFVFNHVSTDRLHQRHSRIVPSRTL